MTRRLNVMNALVKSHKYTIWFRSYGPNMKWDGPYVHVCVYVCTYVRDGQG